MTQRDRVLPPHRQQDGVVALGGVSTLICLSACHYAMVAEPARLADILLQRSNSRPADENHSS